MNFTAYLHKRLCDRLDERRLVVCHDPTGAFGEFVAAFKATRCEVVSAEDSLHEDRGRWGEIRRNMQQAGMLEKYEATEWPRFLHSPADLTDADIEEVAGFLEQAGAKQRLLGGLTPDAVRGTLTRYRSYARSMLDEVRYGNDKFSRFRTLGGIVAYADEPLDFAVA